MSKHPCVEIARFNQDMNKICRQFSFHIHSFSGRANKACNLGINMFDARNHKRLKMQRGINELPFAHPQMWNIFFFPLRNYVRWRQRELVWLWPKVCVPHPAATQTRQELIFTGWCLLDPWRIAPSMLLCDCCGSGEDFISGLGAARLCCVSDRP